MEEYVERGMKKYLQEARDWDWGSVVAAGLQCTVPWAPMDKPDLILGMEESSL